MELSHESRSCLIKLTKYLYWVTLGAWESQRTFYHDYTAHFFSFSLFSCFFFVCVCIHSNALVPISNIVMPIQKRIPYQLNVACKNTIQPSIVLIKINIPIKYIHWSGFKSPFNWMWMFLFTPLKWLAEAVFMMAAQCYLN